MREGDHRNGWHPCLARSRAEILAFFVTKLSGTVMSVEEAQAKIEDYLLHHPVRTLTGVGTTKTIDFPEYGICFDDGGVFFSQPITPQLVEEFYRVLGGDRYNTFCDVGEIMSREGV